MTAPYLLRMLLLCLASFFLVHLVLGSILSLLSRTAIRMAERMQPHWAARFLLTLRLLPAGCAVLIVAAVLAPSYLLLEPRATPAPMGVACLATATLGGCVWALSIARAVRAAARSIDHVRRCQQIGTETRLPGETLPVWVIEEAAPLVMLAGVIHSRLIISRKVLTALSPEQLTAVLRHERAHGSARDNLKRLFVFLAPGLLPFAPGFGSIERGWTRVVEWAADDHAVAGDSQRSVTLAAALVRVARLGTIAPTPPLATSLMANGLDLSARVDRLLRFVPAAGPRRSVQFLCGGATLVLAASVVVVMLQPATFYAAHEFLEELIR